MSRVLRSHTARRDLKEIGRRIAADSGSTEIAVRWLTAFAERCALHATHPEMGELCASLGESVRRFSFGSYVVYFHRVSGGIELLRVWHGSRETPSDWLI
jgi:toxin ParE1/3/4